MRGVSGCSRGENKVTSRHRSASKTISFLQGDQIDCYILDRSIYVKTNVHLKADSESMGRPWFYVTLGNPSAHPGKNITHPFLLFTWKMFILSDLTNINALESISNRISTCFNSILCLSNHTMCIHWFALTCKLKWGFDYNSSFLQRLSSGNRSCCNRNLDSLAKYILATAVLNIYTTTQVNTRQRVR